MANFNYNRVILGGRVTADIELKQTPNGISTCRFSIAINRPYQNKDAGENTQTADFINCVAWRQRAEFIQKYFHKGSSIAVEGALSTRNWTDDQGQKHSITEVVVDNAMFVDSKSENAGSGYSAQPSYANQANEATFETLPSDNDLPF